MSYKLCCWPCLSFLPPSHVRARPGSFGGGQITYGRPEESYEPWMDDACFSDGCRGAVANGEDTNWTELSHYAIKSSFFFVWEVILGRTTIPKPRQTCQTGITADMLPRSGQ